MIIKTKDDNGKDQWTVCRMDGKSWDDGIVGLNFEATSEGATNAIACAKNLEMRFKNG